MTDVLLFIADSILQYIQICVYIYIFALIVIGILASGDFRGMFARDDLCSVCGNL